MCAGIRPTTGAQTHTRKRRHFDTHVWECVARSHRQRCYRQCKHVWRCVLNTHYRGLGKLWKRPGEKTNKPHRVFERGGEGGGGFSLCNSSSITDLSPRANSGFTVLLRQITCAVSLQLWIRYTSTEALSRRGGGREGGREGKRARKTTKGQSGMSIINRVFLNIRWQHRWREPNPSNVWDDVKKPGPHRALSQPFHSQEVGDIAHLRGPSWAGFAQKELITCTSAWSEKENTSTSARRETLATAQFAPLCRCGGVFMSRRRDGRAFTQVSGWQK